MKNWLGIISVVLGILNICGIIAILILDPKYWFFLILPLLLSFIIIIFGFKSLPGKMGIAGIILGVTPSLLSGIVSLITIVGILLVIPLVWGLILLRQKVKTAIKSKNALKSLILPLMLMLISMTQTIGLLIMSLQR